MKEGIKLNLRKALFVLLAILLLYYFPTTIYNRYFNPKYIPISVVTEQEQQNITLPDNSKITLAPSSKFIYTKEFPDDRRKTELQGSASVEVSQDSRPFKLKVKNCILISPKGITSIKEDKNGLVSIKVNSGNFELEEYNREGSLENIYKLDSIHIAVISNYVQIKLIE